MWIESIRIEGGTLNGFQQTLTPGLNVLIGGRGTGKSSVIELIRFCLGAPSSSEAIAKDALEHALGVLGDGKIIITLVNGSERIEVSRIATDSDNNLPQEILPPLVFSQKEIEQVGARSQSRMRLIDGFIAGRSTAAATRGPLHARIKSASTEIRSLLGEVADITEKLLALPKLKERLADLQRQGAEQRARSVELDGLRKQLDELTPLMSAANVRSGSIGRSVDNLSAWTDDLDLVAGRKLSLESWPADAIKPDQLQPIRERLDAAHDRLTAVIAEYRSVVDELEVLRGKANGDKSVLEARGREVRQKIEEQQKGASVLDRQISDLSQEIAALNALADLRADRQDRIDRLHAERESTLDKMHAHSAALTSERKKIAAQLTAGLAPSIRVTVMPLADYRIYVSVLNAALRGSGLRYRELAERIAETFSPQEIATLAERGQVSAISEALEINEERALRLAEGLRGDAGAELLVTEVGEEVVIELLDGTSFKTTDFLSMGQRCTAVLPIILQHNERVIVLDQPEDLDPVIIEGRTGRHRIYRFTEESIAGFMSEFITDIRLANSHDVQKRVAVGHLKKAGIRPAAPYSEIGINLYRVSDIPELKAA